MSELNKLENAVAALEALLFVYGEPLEFKKASKILGISEDETKHAVLRLETTYKSAERGLILVLSSDKIQLATKREFSGLLSSIVKSELSGELTPASLEVLSLVAYGGPISKPEIDYLRGVNSAFILRNLLVRGLVERADSRKSGAYVYQPTFDFLKHLGVSRREDLPEYGKFKELLKVGDNEE